MSTIFPIGNIMHTRELQCCHLLRSKDYVLSYSDEISTYRSTVITCFLFLLYFEFMQIESYSSLLSYLNRQNHYFWCYSK